MAERDERGRFVSGHPCASPGRPRAEAGSKLRDALHGVLDDGTMAKWKTSLRQRLERGDQWATEFVFERITGKVPDRMELAEYLSDDMFAWLSKLRTGDDDGDDADQAVAEA